MSQSVLHEDSGFKERVVLQTSVHWVIFVFPIAWLIAAILLLRYYSDHTVFNRVFVLATVVRWCIALTILLSSNFSLTNQKISGRMGGWGRVSKDILLEHIIEIEVFQSIWGRILGYGALKVHLQNGHVEIFSLMRDPWYVRTLIFHQQSRLGIRGLDHKMM